MFSTWYDKQTDTRSGNLDQLDSLMYCPQLLTMDVFQNPRWMWQPVHNGAQGTNTYHSQPQWYCQVYEDGNPDGETFISQEQPEPAWIQRRRKTLPALK